MNYTPKSKEELRDKTPSFLKNLIIYLVPDDEANYYLRKNNSKNDLINIILGIQDQMITEELVKLSLNDNLLIESGTPKIEAKTEKTEDGTPKTEGSPKTKEKSDVNLKDSPKTKDISSMKVVELKKFIQELNEKGAGLKKSGIKKELIDRINNYLSNT